MSDASGASAIEAIVRGITSAAKSLRLYPASSPIPRQSVGEAMAALEEYLGREGGIVLRVARDGFTHYGTPVGAGSPGAVELADSLRLHGVSELIFDLGVTTEDLLAFLETILSKPEDLAADFGVGGALTRHGISSIRVTEVDLHVAEVAGPGADEDIETFLRELAADPERLAAWLAAAAHGDPAVLDSGLADFVRAVGPEGVESLVASLAQAFGVQDSQARDAIMGLAMEERPSRDLLGDVLGQIASRDLAGSLCEGNYGENMLSMSSALTRLPLAERMSEVLGQVQNILPTYGRSTKEMSLLAHMMEVRTSDRPEAALVDAQPSYRQVIEMSRVTEEQLQETRESVSADVQHADDSAITTMLTLLDQQSDHQLYTRTLGGLTAMIPHLVLKGRLDIAHRIVRELEAREATPSPTWPDLPQRVHAALVGAVDDDAARAILRTAAADPSAIPVARDLVRNIAESAVTALAQEALATRPNGTATAEALIGRRLIDILVALSPKATTAQVGPICAVLGKEGDSRPVTAVETLLRRPDDLARREAAAGLGAAGGPVALRHLGTLLKDSSFEPAVAAVRAIGRSDAPGAAGILSARLDEIDVDGKDFELAREIIGALARTHDPGADAVLTRLAGRKALIKRGHFAEVQGLADQALTQRRTGGGGR